MELVVGMVRMCAKIVFLVRDVKKGGCVDLKDFKIEDFD